MIKILKSKKYIFEISNSDLQIKLIETHSNKLLIKIIDLLNSMNIPIKTSFISYYVNKMINIINKLYSNINILSYQFINYELLKLTFDNNITYYDNLNRISTNLNHIKRAIDTRYFKKWQYITYQLDNYKSLGDYIMKNYEVINDKSQKITNAFLKIYEMLDYYDLIPNIDSLNSFHFCEAPGMFIIGLNHFIKTKTNITNWSWYGNSLSIDASSTALSDYHGLIEKNKDKWLIGPDKSGDIRDLNNIDFFKSKLNEVDFITSDCGICAESSNYNKYEELIAETNFAQFFNLINLLKIGGSGIIKTFIPLELASNVCVIYTLTQLFDEVHLSKPITSRPQNSEVYLICIRFKGIKKDLLNEFRSLLEKEFNPNNKWIKDIPESFLNQLEDYVTNITRQQISYLLNIFYFIDNNTELDKIKLLSPENKLKEEIKKHWCKKFNFQSNLKHKLI